VVVDMSPAEVDLVVVGAGIIGATVAAQAQRRRPTAKVLLLDRSRVGSGATRHSAAFCPPVGSTPAHRQMAERAARWYTELERTGGAPWHRRLTTYWVVPESEIHGFCQEFVFDPPVPAATADLARLHDAYPDLVIRPFETVWCSRDVWAGEAEATARALAARLNRANESACWEGAHVDDVQPEAVSYLVVTRTGQRVRARHVVLATGPWLVDEPGQTRAGWGLRVKKVAAVHLARRPSAGDPAVVFWDEDAFLLPLPAREVTLFSFYCPTWDVRPDADLVLEWPELNGALQVLKARSASMADAAVGSRAFCDGYLPARLPRVAEDPARPGVLLAGGGSGSGFRLAPALAELVVAGLDRFSED
jgi:glycine/D-amino acid oxidase-like deaminating enzyme